MENHSMDITCTVGLGVGAFLGAFAFNFKASCDLNGDPWPAPAIVSWNINFTKRIFHISISD